MNRAERLEALLALLHLGAGAPSSAAERAGPLASVVGVDFLEAALQDPVRAGAARTLAEMGSEAVSGLIAALDAGPRVAGAALAALEIVRDPATAPDIVRQLRRGSRVVRARAVAALVAIGPSSLGALARTNLDARGLVWAVRALGKIGNEAAIGPLVERLGHNSRAVRAEAAKALIAVGPPSVPAVLAVASRRDAGLLEAVQALAGLADARAATQLAGLLTHDRVAVRSTAAYGLERIGPACRPAVAAVLEQSKFRSVEAAQVLSRVSDESAVAALDAALASPEARVRRAAAIGLGRIERPVITSNLRRAARDTEATVRIAAVWALGRSDDAASEDAIIEASHDTDPQVRAASARALSGSVTAQEALVQLLDDEAPSVRAAAAQGLRVPFSAAAPALRRLIEDEAWHVRRAALGSLSRLGWEPGEPSGQALHALGSRDWPRLLAVGAPAADWLVENLNASDVRLRRLVADALIRFGELAREPARVALLDGPARSRAGAAQVLGAIGGSEEVAALVNALGDPEASVRRSAARALNHLGDWRGNAEALPSSDELEEEGAVDYVEVRAAAPSPHVDDVIGFLSDVLPHEWAAIYAAHNPHPPNIFVTSVAGFDYLFDNPEHLVLAGELDARVAVADRLVAVHGRSGLLHEERDDSRLRPFPLGPVDPSVGSKGRRYDRGHVMGHALGGGLDINLIPQVAGTNQGSSEEGKRFRAMERYAAEHPGVYCFARPLYAGFSGHPLVLEFGVLKEDGTLWLERFRNVTTGDEAEEIERLYRETVLKR